MKMLLENLPQSLQPQRETLRRCLEAMDRALPLERVLLFGSYARGEARADSDVDLCLVSDGAERQLDAARQFRLAITGIWPHPPFKELHACDPGLAESLTQLCAELDEVYFIDRYPGFDLEEEDWPALRAEIAEVDRLFAAVQARL